MTRTARVDITFPKESEVRAAVQGQRELTAYLATNFDTQRIQILDDRNVAHQIELPTSALRLLADILVEFAVGNGVGIVPVHPELTIQEAADLLNVSRPHFVKLLETQALPRHGTREHRRIRFDDLMKFKAARDQASERAVSALTEQAQELKLGYE
jgi:excisionase family DNA binding protein